VSVVVLKALLKLRQDGLLGVGYIDSAESKKDSRIVRMQTNFMVCNSSGIHRFPQYGIDSAFTKLVQLFISIDKQYGEIRSQFNTSLEILS
jgi:hypothetical protein